MFLEIIDIAISPVGNSVYCTNKQGQLFACGANDFGQLALGDDNNRNKLTQVKLLDGKKVDRVFPGAKHIHVLFTDGTLFACGRNLYGQLALGNDINRNTLTKVNLPDRKKVDRVFPGGYHIHVLFTDGTLFACGRNEFGQLALGDNNRRDTLCQLPNCSFVFVDKGIKLGRKMLKNERQDVNVVCVW